MARLLLVIALLLWAPVVWAQACSSRVIIVAMLARNFQEVPVWSGFSGNRTIEIFSREGGKSWTLVISHPNGTSCLITHGDSYIDVKRVPAGTETRKQ